MKEVVQILHLLVIVIIVIHQIIFLVNLKKKEELVVYNVNLDFIEVKDNLVIVNLLVILVTFLIPQRDIFKELVLLHLVYHLFQIMKKVHQIFQLNVIVIIVIHQVTF